MAVRATLRVRHHGCPTADFSGDVWISHASSDPNGDLFVLHAPTDGMDNLLAIWEKKAGPLRVLDRDDGVLAVRGKAPVGGLLDSLTALGIAVQWPATYAHGWEEFPLVSPGRSELRGALAAAEPFGHVQLVGVHETQEHEMVSASPPLHEVLAGLSARQLEVVRAAVATGHVARPRSAPLANVAAAVGLSDSTAGEHLRKATAALLEAVTAAVDSDPRLAHAARKGPGRPRGRDSGPSGR